MKRFLTAISLLFAASLHAFEVEIQKGPVMDAGPNTFFNNWHQVKDGMPLMTFLGGADAIDRILIGTPTANVSQIDFSASLVRERMAGSISVESQKNHWHYAPYTMGTIYWKDGRKHNFTLYLSGISIGGHLFAVPNNSSDSQGN